MDQCATGSLRSWNPADVVCCTGGRLCYATILYISGQRENLKKVLSYTTWGSLADGHWNKWVQKGGVRLLRSSLITLTPPLFHQFATRWSQEWNAKQEAASDYSQSFITFENSRKNINKVQSLFNKLKIRILVLKGPLWLFPLTNKSKHYPNWPHVLIWAAE